MFCRPLLHRFGRTVGLDPVSNSAIVAAASCLLISPTHIDRPDSMCSERKRRHRSRSRDRHHKRSSRHRESPDYTGRERSSSRHRRPPPLPSPPRRHAANMMPANDTPRCMCCQRSAGHEHTPSTCPAVAAGVSGIASPCRVSILDQGLTTVKLRRPAASAQLVAAGR